MKPKKSAVILTGVMIFNFTIPVNAAQHPESFGANVGKHTLCTER